MTAFDYGAAAELFSRRSSRFFGPQPVSYRRFAHAADAIRVAIEELSETSFASAYLQVDEERFDSRGMRELYENSEYPLVRQNRERGAVAHEEPAAPRTPMARAFIGKRDLVQ